jgi:molybdate transport system ATP-binding protein
MADALHLSVELRQDAPIPLDVAFECRAGDVLAIYGASGSGKTTILRAIAGLYRARHGRVACGGELWTETGRGLHVPTRQRPVGFVFQEYALFPHLTVRDNVLAALGHRPAAERKPAADRWLTAVHLEGLASRRPAELSGGQRQRVALARALAREPAVLLLDEPFAAIDQAARHRLREELDQVRGRLRMPVVLVTHDFHDVVRLATHVIAGHIGSIGPMGADQAIVQVVVGETRLLAQITHDAVQRLALRPGTPVFALVKSVSIEMDGRQPGVGQDAGGQTKARNEEETCESLQ